MENSNTSSPRYPPESIASRSIQHTKRVFVCRNGDSRYHKRTLFVNQKRYPTLGAFCDDVTKLFSKTGYYKGCVRKIYEENGKPVTELEDIDDGMLLVCGALEEYRPPSRSRNVQYHEIEPPFARVSPRRERAPPVGSHNKNFMNIEPKFHKIKNEGININIQENGKENEASHRFLLRSKLLDKNDMEPALREMSKQFEPYNIKISHLFTPSGELIEHPRQLQKDGIYVACSSDNPHKFIPATYAVMHEPKNFVCSKGQGYPIPYFLNDPFRKPLNKQIVQKPLSETEDTPRKHFTRMPIAPINKHHSPNQSVASNPEYGSRRPGRRTDNGVPHTYPVKHVKQNNNKGSPKHAPLPPKKRNDHILTNGNDKSLFKATKGREETKGAKEVKDTKDTHTDVPLDQQKAEVVKDEVVAAHDGEVSDESSALELNRRPSDDSDQFQEEKIKGQTSKPNSVTMHHDKKLNPHEPLPAISTSKKDSDSDRMVSPTDTEKDKKQEMTEDEAATIIQSSFRGHKDRQKVEELKEEKKNEETVQTTPTQQGRQDNATPEMTEDQAATKIQAAFRGHQSRVETEKLKEEGQQVKNDSNQNSDKGDREKEEEAAIKIQSHIRGHQARKEVQRIKEDQAAVTIQASIRGHQARKEVQKKREEAEKSQKKTNESSLTEEEKEEMAATTIQASIRGHQARKEVEKLKQEKAATTIQASIRGYQARKELSEKREQYDKDKAATTIQASVRGFLTRKELQEKKNTRRTSTPVKRNVEEDADVAPTSTQDKPSEKQSPPAPPRENTPGKVNDSQGNDKTTSGKDKNSMGNDITTTGNDNTTQIKDSTAQIKDNDAPVDSASKDLGSSDIDNAKPGAAVAQPGPAVAQPGAAVAQPGPAVAQPGAAVAQPGTAVAQQEGNKQQSPPEGGASQQEKID